MPSRVVRVLGSYDVFAKSLPGMVFLLAILTILPLEFLSYVPTDQPLASFATLLITVVILGTLIGEAVHTFAVHIENTIALIGRRLKNTYRLLGKLWQKLDGIHEPLVEPQPPDPEDLIGRGIPSRIKENWKYGILKWISKRIMGIKFALIGHRILFQSQITAPLKLPKEQEEQRDLEEQRRERENLDRVRGYLVETSEKEFNIKSEKDAERIYPVITTLLSSEGISRPDRFQSRYSFCRSMWVILLVTGIVYLSTLEIQTYDMLITGLDRNSTILVGSLLIIFSGMFMAASGRYKKYYVEYLISGFYALERMNEKTERGEEEEEPSGIRNRILERAEKVQLPDFIRNR